jgi:hypothetical protein
MARKLSIDIVLIISLFSFPIYPTFADEFLSPIFSIPILHDSVKISSITPIGDFNADGYLDLAIGVGHKTTIPQFEAVYLHFGGNGFDSIPDITFLADTNNVYCPPRNSATGYGEEIIALADYNGDGYNDFAVSAPGLCIDTYHEGRIYVYFGDPNPDSIADLLIDGFHDYDGMGKYLASGDVNGDGLSDVIAKGGDPWYGEHITVFFGNDYPDSIYYWNYDISGDNYIYELSSGFDINGDGYDEFSVRGMQTRLIWGGNTMTDPQILESSAYYSFFNFDISGDSIDDFSGYFNSQRQLCFGGNPIDFTPDRPIASIGSYRFIYRYNGSDSIFLADDSPNNRFIGYLFDPLPDSMPFCFINYNFRHFLCNPYVGDINLDGIDELALGSSPDSFYQHVDIYSIQRAGIENEPPTPSPHFIALSAYPNPFNSATTITLTSAEQAEIGIYDITGRLITTLHTIGGQALWDASAYSSGLYFARVAREKAGAIKLVLIK